MNVLYHINNVRFIVEYNRKKYIVSLPKREALEIDDIDAESILRQGYWQAVKNIDDEIKQACISLIEVK